MRQKLVSLICGRLFISLYCFLLGNPFDATSATLVFDDATHPEFPTAVEGVDLTPYGFRSYDVFFVSGREQTIDGWGAVEAAYRSEFTDDVFPNVPDSTDFSHLIKREIVRVFNSNAVPLISGLSNPGETTFEHHTGVERDQRVLLPYLSEIRDGIEVFPGTFVSKNLASGEWGTDDLMGNNFVADLNSGTGSAYWAIVTDSISTHELFAGDANQDFRFDQADILQVLFPRPKYLTGEPATWGEGDWNGAPGGSLGDPPLGDGVFDQRDLIAALAPGHYLTGPYAGLSSADAALTVVPEPISLVLLGIGAIVYLVRWPAAVSPIARPPRHG